MPRCSRTVSSGTRPLRNAKATDTYVLRGGGAEGWEPSFTFHGFRYVEVDGWPGELDPTAFTAVVVHSDMRAHRHLHVLRRAARTDSTRTWCGACGATSSACPTDCPQRDERLGWTGDLQVFAPTASFLYDVAGFLDDWLADLRVEQYADGAMPLVVPDRPARLRRPVRGRRLGRRSDDRAVDRVRALRRSRRAGPPVRQHAGLGRLGPAPGRRRRPLARGVPARATGSIPTPRRTTRRRPRPMRCSWPPPTSPVRPRSSATPPACSD